MTTKPDKEPKTKARTEADEDRRRFLAKCGKFAIVTPPAVAMLLSTSMKADAFIRSGGYNPS
jgi:hypothetical protein